MFNFSEFLGSLRVDVIGDIGDVQNKLGSVSSTVQGIGTKMTLFGAPAIATVLGMGASSVSMENQFRDATNNIQGALGLTEEGADSLGTAVRDIFGNNFGEDIKEVEQGVIAAEQQFARLGGVSTDVMAAATENAFRLNDAYEIELAESLSAAATLMDEFDLTQQEAFDFLTSGFQNGLNASDDFLDSIGEYSNLFAQGEAGADQFFSLLQTGAKGGVLGTDKIADTFKEFQIKFLEGGDEMEAAVASLTGDSWEMFIQEIQAGDSTVTDVFGTFTRLLGEMEDPIERNRLAVALMGPQAEDLGASFVDGLSLASTSLEDMSGATAMLDEQYKDWPSMLEGLRRGFLEAFGPLSGTLLDVAAENMPAIQEAVGGLAEQISANMPQIIEFVEGFIQYLATDGPSISQILAGIGVAFGVMGAAGVIGPIVIGLGSVISAISGIVGFFGTLTAGVAAVSAAFGGAATVTGGLSAALALIGGPITLVIAGIALLAVAWARDWGGIQAKTFAAVAAVRATIQPIIDYFTTIWTQSGPQIMAGVDQLWLGIQQRFQVAFDLVKLVFGLFTGEFKGNWTQFGVELRAIVDAYLVSIGNIWGGLGAIVTPYLAQFWADIQAWWNNIDWAGLGKAVISGIASGFDPTALIDKAKGVASAVKDTFTGFFDIQSPSGLMRREVGAQLSAGLGLGLQDGTPEIEAQAARSVANVPNVLSSGLEDVAIGGGGVAPAGAGGGRNITINLPNLTTVYGVSDLKEIIRQAVETALGEEQQSGATLNRALSRGLI